MYMYQVPKNKTGSHTPLEDNTRNPTNFRSVENSGPSTDQGEYTGRNHNFVNGGIYNTTKKKVLLPAISLGYLERVKYNRNHNES